MRTASSKARSAKKTSRVAAAAVEEPSALGQKMLESDLQADAEPTAPASSDPDRLRQLTAAVDASDA